MSASTYYSFREQTFHYFSRPHDAAPAAQVSSPAAWTRAQLEAARPRWRYSFTAADIAELESAIEYAKSLGKRMGALTSEDFPAPALAERIARWRDEIQTGVGLVVLGGLPTDKWGEADSSLFFWCLGLQLGRPGAQNNWDELLGHVRDTGADKDNPFVRQYLTTQNIPFHCDAADIVGLLCLNTAKRGGQSRIASSVAIFNEVLKRRPDLAPRLFEPFMLDVREEKNEDGIKFLPIPPCRFGDGVLRTFYHAEYFRTSQRHDGVRLTAEESALLDLYDEIAASDDYCFEMNLEPGDIQLLSNHTVVHARSDYEDHDAADKKRHLLRLWLSILD